MTVLRIFKSLPSATKFLCFTFGILFLGLQHAQAVPRQIGVCNSTKATQPISFVHISDLHGRFGASFADKWAKLRYYYELAATTNPYTVFTDAGDDYEKGSVAELISEGAAAREAVFAMGFDVRALGNHDFAWGEKELLPYSHDPKSIVLASNTAYRSTNPSGFGGVDYAELQVGCVKVGFFGMVSQPWNEFDSQYVGDFLPNFTQRWDWVTRAQEIITAHRSSVDILVMVSHLGFNTDAVVVNGTPKATDATTSNIDLVLGGHNHDGFQSAIAKKTLIVQPEYFANGLTQIDLVWDLKRKRLVSRLPTPKNVYTTVITGTNTTLQQSLRNIADKYAPEAEKQIGQMEVGHNYVQLATIAATAGMFDYQADAALIDPTKTWVASYNAGPVTQQMMLNLYLVERQKSGTPGFNGFYTATVSGTDLAAMKAAQPSWVYVGASSPSPTALYTVLLHKAPALNPASFFPATTRLTNVAFKSEAWLALDQYARSRTAACLYMDTNNTLPSCQQDTFTTVWNFNDSTQPFLKDRGTAALAYRDTANSGWGPQFTAFASTTALGIPNLPNGASGVMAFPRTFPTEGYTITHGFPANGAFNANGLVSNYTLVMDVLWPFSSDGLWRSLLQTNLANNDDGDWFVNNVSGGGIGINGQYFGSLQPGVWNRIGIVVTAQATGGTLQFYINGQLAGTITSAGQRFALSNQLLAFTDDDSETAPGYLNAMLLSNRAFTATEIASLAGPSAIMTWPTSNAATQAASPLNGVSLSQPPTVYRGPMPQNGMEHDNKAAKLRLQ
ncbi:MAG: metallophosphoesterase [Methyloglobulus sp.]|nr:metallophosphatase [Methyloglobulus sp.]